MKKLFITTIGMVLFLLLIFFAYEVFNLHDIKSAESVPERSAYTPDPSVLNRLGQNSTEKTVIYRDKVVVLVFHHIDTNESPGVTISPEHFVSDLDMLQNKGYNVISLEQLRQFLKGGSVPDNSVLITFDDGYESAYKYALPELVKRNMPAVEFVIGSYTNASIGTLNYLNWEEMKEMSASGFNIQSHTYDMHKLTTLNDGKTGPILTGLLKYQSLNDFSNEVYQDIKRSKDEIENNLQQPVYALALPFGSANNAAIKAASNAGMELIFTGQAGVVTRNSNPLALPRVIAGSPLISATSLDQRIKFLIHIVK